MSANTAIKEGGNPHSFGPVDYLRVASGSDQYALWVPESERQLTTKSISKNGIYRASDDGAYGWSSVYVNVPAPESITGKDGDGDEVVVKPDPDTGVLEEEKVPSSIEVITPPTKLDYQNNEVIDYSGISVKAYYASDEEWGDVPFNELIFPVTVAVLSPDYEAQTGYSSDLDISPLTHPIGVTEKVEYIVENGRYEITEVAGEKARFYVIFNETYNQYEIRVASNEPFTLYAFYYDTITHSSRRNEYTASSLIINGKTVYQGVVMGWRESGGFELTYGPTVQSAPDVPSDHLNNAAYTVAYGQATVVGESVTIPVMWARPGDGLILETSFDINVYPTSQE